MQPNHLIDSLERFGQMLPAVVADIPDADARWQPPDGAWSILQIVRHLADEEVEDFRARLRSTLDDPATPWHPNDPEQWAIERRYNEGSLNDAVASFVEERRRSILWLRQLVATAAPPWDNAYRHPKAGPIRAGDLMASWAAHDALHLRQIAKRMFQMAQRDGEGYSTLYAGEWKA